jgi:hypothetical protein
MIPVTNPIPEPPDFDARCRQKGNEWLTAPDNAGRNDFPSHWRQFSSELAAGFQQRCGWWAMRIQSGTIDHFLSKSKPANRHLIYEWSNYRYAESTLNSSKNNDDGLIDPFEVEDGWFEVDLNTMLLVPTSLIPEHLREKAEATVKKLNAKKVRENRWLWYADYTSGKINMSGLMEYAPLVAIAEKNRVKWDEFVLAAGREPNPLEIV